MRAFFQTWVSACFGVVLLFAVIVGCSPGSGSSSNRAVPSGAKRHALSAATPVPGSGYDAAVLALSPYAYYRLDETSGTVAYDSSGNGLNGTYEGTSGTDYTLGQTAIVPGLAASLQVHATNPGQPKVLLPTMNLGWNGSAWLSDFSIVEWVKPDPSDLEQFALPMEVNDYYFYQGTGGAASYTPAMGAYAIGNWASPTQTFKDGNAHFLAMTIHRTSSGTCSMALYVDATLATSVTTTCTGAYHIVASTNAGLGSRVSYVSGGDPYFGEIGGAAIFSSALTAPQVVALYSSAYPAPGAPNSSYDSAVLALSPYAYYRLNETAGAIAYDASGNARNGLYHGVDSTDYSLGQPSILPGDTGGVSAEFFATNAGEPKVVLPSMNLGWNGSTWVSDFTTAAWMQPASSHVDQFGMGVDINDYYLYQGTTSAAPAYTPAMGAYDIGNWASPTATFEDGNPHFIAVTIHQNTTGTCTMILYVDGAQATTSTATCAGDTAIVATTNAGIAARASYSAGAQGYFGEMAGVAVFSSALSASQISGLYAPGTPTPTPTPCDERTC